MVFSDHFVKELQDWRRMDEETVGQSSDGMKCCAYCGTSKFGGDAISKAKMTMVEPQRGLPPAGMGNGTLLPHMTRASDGKWFRCVACTEPEARKNRVKHVVHMTPDYTRKILGAHPLHIQMLSLIDISMNFVNRFDQVAKAEVNPEGLLLSSPLVCQGPPPPDGTGLDEDCRDILAINVNNPSFKRYKSLAELPIPSCGLPLVPEEAIRGIVQSAAARDPRGMMMERDMVAKVRVFWSGGNSWSREGNCHERISGLEGSIRPFFYFISCHRRCCLETNSVRNGGGSRRRSRPEREGDATAWREGHGLQGREDDRARDRSRRLSDDPWQWSACT